MKIALLGYGKMGKTIDGLNSNHEIVHRISKDNINIEELFLLNRPDVIIEFTEPKSVHNHISLALDLNIPMVIGTTGWATYLDEVRASCSEKNGSIFYASNFSIGANIFFYLNKIAANMVNRNGNYGVRLSETHHKTKKDKPSGTAITMADSIIQEMDNYKAWHLGDNADITSIHIESQREGEVKGLHRVEFFSNEDSISISHDAKNRDGFAYGALKAAEWIVDKKGMYTMDDMLAINGTLQ